MEQTLNEAIADVVRRELEERHSVTQRWIGQQLGLPQASVWHRIHGRIEWRPSELEALAHALGIPVTRFVRVPARRAA